VPDLAQAAKSTRAWACYDCGKCTATCPIARIGGDYSPRRHVLATNLGHRGELVHNGSLFACLTCSLCDRRCPAEVGYTELVRELRGLSHKEGVEPECPHGGALHSVMRMMAAGGVQQKRMNWLTDDLRTKRATGDVLYWTGCTMYYDAFFPDFQVNTLAGTRAAVRVLNKLGITPVVSPEERCCGHDLLWNGDRGTFEQLARYNTKLVADSGAKLLLVSCAECLRTWKLDYEPYFEAPPPQIMHITEYLVDRLPDLTFKANGTHTVTYQDPCRMGRHLGIYDPPRQLLEAVPGIELREMRRSGPAAACCAGSTWSNCDRFAKQIQVDRLREARATGAEVLATACPKCQVHFNCSMKDPDLGDEIRISMRDVVEFLDDVLDDPQTARKQKDTD
jgi:Fe-S oxidoreductase